MEPGGPLQSNNIINRKGGVESSLFQSCLMLRRRLECVPGFEPWLDEMEAEEQEEDGDTDPVTSMWNMLRRGEPLLTVFNSTNPAQRIEPKQHTKLSADNPRFGKQSTFEFLAACFKQLNFASADCFIVTDLYGTDTTGFVKVLRVVNRVLDVAEERGQLYSLASTNDLGADGAKPKTHAENVIHEIVTTERDYVQHLETLQEFQVLLQQANILPGDTIHSIFMNLNQLLDFQRRFLIRVEQQNSLDTELQNWGQLFHMYKEQFRVYEPFIANQTRCNDTVTKEWERVRSAPLPPSFQGMVETQSVLLGFLLKPFQRLVKYPMLLEQLIKRGGYDDERVNDLRLGVEATNGILTSANEAVAREARVAAAHDLQVSVEDWKGIKLEEFGELLIFGGQTVLKGDGSKEIEREYKVYLFEKILLCCKDVNPNKAKNKLAGKSAQKSKQRLQLKGRIWMNTITDILHYSKSNSFYLNIYWRSDPAIENFIIRYVSKETRDKWKGLIEQQRRARNEFQGHSPSRRAQQQHPTDAYSMSGATLVNAGYHEDEEEDDEVRYTPTTNSMSSNSGLTNSRNASTGSLRSRSATGGSGPPPPPPPAVGRIPPPRFPVGEAYGSNGLPLRVQTNGGAIAPGALTPDDRLQASYFSPTNESPSSSIRTSTQTAGGFNFTSGRQSTAGSGNSWMNEQTKHMTAPPISRAQPDELHPNRSQRPSLPVSSSNGFPSHGQPNSRSRSASSPQHVQPPGADRRSGGAHVRTPNDDEPMPPLPPHMVQKRGPVNRSQSNSPTETYRSLRGQPSHPPPLNRAPQTFPTGLHDPRVPIQGLANSTGGPVQPPTQLRVKICFEPRPSHVTIVVPNVIRYQTLVDRIDAKMERISSSSISKGSARLKYSDSDNDLITIGNDEDVKAAIEEWTENNEAALRQQLVPDFELWWSETGARVY